MLINVNLPVAGSYIDRWRPDSCSGKTCAEGWLDPCLQKSGFAGARTLAVNQTRPFFVHHRVVRRALAVPMGSAPQ